MRITAASRMGSGEPRSGSGNEAGQERGLYGILAMAHRGIKEMQAAGLDCAGLAPSPICGLHFTHWRPQCFFPALLKPPRCFC